MLWPVGNSDLQVLAVPFKRGVAVCGSGCVNWRMRERRVVLWPVSCGVAGGGAGYARAARRAGSCSRAETRRPASQGPAAPQVGKESPAAPVVCDVQPGCGHHWPHRPGGRACRDGSAVHPAPATMEPLCTPPCDWCGSGQQAGAGTPSVQACAGCVAPILTLGLHPWSGAGPGVRLAPGHARPARPGALGRRPAARGYPAGAPVVPVMTRPGRRAWATSRAACQHSLHIG